MSNHPGVKQTLALLNSLRGSVREFAAREEKLTREFHTETAKERQLRDDAIADLKTQLPEEIAKADSSFQAAAATAKSRYERRKSRIHKAHKASQKKTLMEIDDDEGHRKHRLQTETLQSRRTRETDLKAAETTFEKFKNTLAAGQEDLRFLEQTARNSFRGYGEFLRLLFERHEMSQAALAQNEQQLIAELQQLLGSTRSDLDRFQTIFLARVFKYRPIWLLLLFCQIPLVLLLHLYGVDLISYQDTAGAILAFLAAGFILYFIGRRCAKPLATRIAGALSEARSLHDACLEKSEIRYRQGIEQIEAEFQNKSSLIDQQWTLALEEAAEMRESGQSAINAKATRVSARNEKVYRLTLEQFERDHPSTIERVKKECEARIQEAADSCGKKEIKFNADSEAQWRELEADWKRTARPIWQTIDAVNADVEALFPSWDRHIWENWTPPQKFGHVAKFARLEVDVEKLCEAVPKDKRLALPGSSRFFLPLLLTHPDQGSILFETTDAGRGEALGALNSIVLRLLSIAPPGRLNFTVIDPVGLGQSFSAVMHLADYADHLINSRIWTQTSHIEQRLAELNEHMEKVIQMYLRNEYATIAEYNEEAGNIAEKYHFLVVADFPANFSDAGVKHLLSVAASGARCGVFILIHWDRRQPVPQDFDPEELRRNSVPLNHSRGAFFLTGESGPGTNLVLDPSPAQDIATDFIHKVGLSSRDSNRVEVPFSHVAPSEADLWTFDTTAELCVPIGRTGATKLQYLAIGKDTRQHALIAGKTGSGKSTLFHVIITNLSLWCSPEQVEFYLVDFKKGVEFKCYAAKRLPHARVVALESDREFGLSVLQRVDDELRRRGEMFRKLGVQNIVGFKKAGGTEAVPRSLLIIDEFQEFFVEDDRISQSASVLLDRIVRQGRAFGIHVLLGSQTLGGAYTVARTTLGQMVIRIALQCNEADAYLIMDDDNPAPRLLSRPGEGIYNDNGGAIQGNSPFQAVWLPDEVRDTYLEKVRRQADRTLREYAAPIIFEGNAPANVRENTVLRALLKSESIRKATSARIWLGAPNSIKGPTESVFRRQSGNNLLIVGQRDEAILAILSIALVSLATQYPLEATRFVLIDGTPPDSPEREFLGRIVQAIPHQITLAKSSDFTNILNGLVDDIRKRSDEEEPASTRATFLLIHDLQKHHKLRYEEDFSFSVDSAEAAPEPGAQLNNLICQGARLGIHVIASCDTYNNVNRFCSRKAISEFGMRVLFQMSPNDSASLIDSPKASTLGLHRGLYYNEQEGYVETFRPYALPTSGWIEEAAENLARLLR